MTKRPSTEKDGWSRLPSGRWIRSYHEHPLAGIEYRSGKASPLHDHDAPEKLRWENEQALLHREPEPSQEVELLPGEATRLQ